MDEERREFASPVCVANFDDLVPKINDANGNKDKDCMKTNKCNEKVSNSRKLNTWTCKHCSLFNYNDAKKCIACFRHH